MPLALLRSGLGALTLWPSFLLAAPAVPLLGALVRDVARACAPRPGSAAIPLWYEVRAERRPHYIGIPCFLYLETVIPLPIKSLSSSPDLRKTSKNNR